MVVALPSGKRMTMKPPPPMLPAVGCVTASANPVAMAASTALPPLRRTRAPTSLAIHCWEETTPPRVRTTSCDWASARPTENGATKTVARAAARASVVAVRRGRRGRGEAARVGDERYMAGGLAGVVS